MKKKSTAVQRITKKPKKRRNKDSFCSEEGGGGFGFGAVMELELTLPSPEELDFFVRAMKEGKTFEEYEVMLNARYTLPPHKEKSDKK